MPGRSRSFAQPECRQCPAQVALDVIFFGGNDGARFRNFATSPRVARVKQFPDEFGAIGGQRLALFGQIAVMRAEHQFFSDWTSRSLRWFAAYP